MQRLAQESRVELVLGEFGNLAIQEDRNRTDAPVVLRHASWMRGDSSAVTSNHGSQGRAFRTALEPHPPIVIDFNDVDQPAAGQLQRMSRAALCHVLDRYHHARERGPVHLEDIECGIEEPIAGLELVYRGRDFASVDHSRMHSGCRCDGGASLATTPAASTESDQFSNRSPKTT